MALLLLFAFATAGCGSQSATQGSSSAPVIRAALQGAYDTWPAWELSQTGQDKKDGFQLKMSYFDSGPDQLEVLASNQDDIAQIGPSPSLVGALQYNLQIVGIVDDESMCTDILARPDSPILKTKGYNPQYPDVYGAPQDLKGKDVFVSTDTTGEVLLISYLKALGLSEKDVHVVDMEQPQMLSAFESGKGDLAVMWSPFTYTGLDKGWKVVADATSGKAPAIIFIVATQQFCNQHPDLVEKYLNGIFTEEAQLKTNESTLGPEYCKYLQSWSALTWEPSLAQTDMQKHLVYGLKDQLAWFDDSKGPSPVENLLSQTITDFTNSGKFTPAQAQQLMKFNYINATFLKQLAKQQGVTQ
jgi:NitT/TauT family transport system substrate-binding protein/sulfonate transport system substrate-binding protein